MNKIFTVGALLAAAMLVVITTAATMTYALERDIPSERCSNNIDQHLSSAPSQASAIQGLREGGICHGQPRG
jgi:hypothetical protein